MGRARHAVASAACLAGSALVYWLGLGVLLARSEPSFAWPGPNFGFPATIAAGALSLAALATTASENPALRKAVRLSAAVALTVAVCWLVGYAAAKLAT